MLKKFNDLELRVVCTKDNIHSLLAFLQNQGYVWADGELIGIFDPFVGDMVSKAVSEKVFISAWGSDKVIIWGDYPMDATTKCEYIEYDEFKKGIWEEYSLSI